MTNQIPVVDLEAAQNDLGAVRAAVEQIGLVQVVNHGIDAGLIEEFQRRTGELLARPRAEKAKLASPTGHPYLGWRQWPDDFGRLELSLIHISEPTRP